MRIMVWPLVMRSSSDSIVMRILRSAMDKTHEKLQFKDGPIEFLHERTVFYKLASILVEGGLNIVQEETHVLEGGCNEIISDLMEIRQWLEGRIRDMKQLIFQKDRELADRLENEAKLRQALDQKERELFYLHEKIEPGGMKNDDPHDLQTSNQDVHDEDTDGDIYKLKSSVDQQVLNIKQKLEDEKKILTSERRDRRSRISSPNLSFDFLDERTGSLPLKEADSFGIDTFDNMKPLSELSRLNANVLIKRMSSDIDILKETLDLAFGKMQSAEVLPLEKQWRSKIEKDIESILVKGFIVEVKNKVGILKGNWSNFMDEMRMLLRELKDFFAGNESSPIPIPKVRRTTSEPLLDFSCMENLLEDDANESSLVAKMIKNHESIICKQREQDQWLMRERSSCTVKREKDSKRQKRRIQDAVKRLENFEFAYETCLDSNKAEEEREGLCLQISIMEDIYQLLFLCMMKDVTSVSDSTHNAGVDNPDEILQHYLESTIREDLHIVFFKELAESWKSERVGSAIKEDVHQLVITEAAKDVNLHSMESKFHKQISFQDRTPRSRKFNCDSPREGTPCSRRLHADNSHEGTPRSRADGDESLIEKLDSLLKCVEAEEDLMMKASSIIKEHSVSNSLVILNCEEMDERDAIEWLITDDESAFSSVSEKLERALQQLYTSKELLAELEYTLDVSDEQDDDVASDNVLALIMQFQKVFNYVEHSLLQNLETKTLRLQVLKTEIDTLIQPVCWMRRRKLLYKEAFISRCHNLRLAETEVDLLGDQVESFLYLLERTYVVLNQNATLVSANFEVYDILKLIELELNNSSISNLD